MTCPVAAMKILLAMHDFHGAGKAGTGHGYDFPREVFQQIAV